MMNMVPRAILSELSRLRRSERLLRLAWGGARWLGLAFVALALSCLIDWIIDRYTETPFALRALLSVLQVGLWIGAAWFLILSPLLRRLTYSKLALLVEGKNPQLQHRLISAVELNAPYARTQGMSPDLIGAVTREAERMLPRVDFRSAIDRRRGLWSGLVAGPVVLAAVLAFVLFPNTLPVLLARQLLMDRDIPRSIYLQNQTAEVWPAGEEVTLRFRVWGTGLASDIRGAVRATPDGGPTEEYDLVFESMSGDEATFTAKVRPMSADFGFTASLLDGRTHSESRVRYVARPAFARLDAWMQLPEYCGLQADGSRHEVPQPRGDVAGLPNTSVRVAIQTQQPIVSATLEILGPPYPDLSRPTGESTAQRNSVDVASTAAAVALLPGPTGLAGAVASLALPRTEVVLRRFTQTFPDGAMSAEWTFDLLPTETSYRVSVLDRYGFANAPSAPRTLSVVAERPPQVALLPERFLPRPEFRLDGRDEDFEVDGLPLVIEEDGKPGAVRIAYQATGPYGLGSARLRYRAIKKSDGSQEGSEGKEARWQTLLLTEADGAGAGPFDPKRGLFQDSKDTDEVPFHARPTPAPPYLLPRSVGGGNFVFKTAGIYDDKGALVELRPGDQVEYYIEVFNRNPNLDERVVGRSETRVKTVVSDLEFARWVFDTLQEESRLRQIEGRQRGVFQPK